MLGAFQQGSRGRSPSRGLSSRARPASATNVSVISVSKLLRQRSTLLLCVLLALVVGGTFLPVLHNGFINYDDPVYVYSNPHVTGGLSWPDIRWAFHSLDRGFWHPLTWLSIQLDCELYGLEAWGHHLSSLLLHTASTVLLFLVLFRMSGAKGRSAFAAALFGLHPLHVESVVWASERKDVLSTFFFMLTLLAYVRYVEARGRSHNTTCLKETPNTKYQAPEKLQAPSSKLRPSSFRNPQSAVRNGSNRQWAIWYALALGFFVLGLMSKAMLVTVPFVLLLLDFWPLRRLALGASSLTAPQPGAGGSAVQGSTFDVRRSRFAPVLLEKLPFLALSLVFGLLTLLAQGEAGAVQTVTRFPLRYRVDNAVLVAWEYLGQMLWPAHLAVFYSYPRAFSLLSVALAALGLVLVSAGVLWAWRRRPYLAFGWVWYVAMLLPVIGLLQVGSQAHADRYTYLPLIGIFVLLSWGGYDLALRWSGAAARGREGLLTSPPALKWLGAGAVVLTAACCLITRRQISYWHDGEAVLRHAIKVSPNNGLAHNNLGAELTAQARRLETERRGTANPGMRSQLQDRVARLELEALREFEAAVRAAPDYAMAQGNLGAALLHEGRLAESIAHSRQAVKLLPNYAGAHRNLGVALGKAGRLDEALAELQLAVRLAPGDVEARYNLSFALLQKGRTNEAKAQLAQAKRLLQAHF